MGTNSDLFWGHFTSEDLGALQTVFEVYKRIETHVMVNVD